MPVPQTPRPADPAPTKEPPVYGGQWGGGGGKPNAPTAPAPDRPGRIETPNEKN